MRKAFVDALIEFAAADPRVMLLTADVGFLAIEPFCAAFPDRFFNVGVAEQNMIAIATGLAEAGLRPYTYTIASFASLRPLEFIRNGPVLHRLPVRMVGMGMGFEYGFAGSTHYALEDVAVMRTLAGLTVVIPADSSQASAAFHETYDLPGPVYYSLAKHDHAPLTESVPFRLGRLEALGSGNDIAIVAMGSLVPEAVAASDEMRADGIHATVFLVSSFNPDPEDDLAEALSRFDNVITVEAQTASGGLGACVGTIVAQHGLRTRLHPLAVRDAPDGTHGAPHNRWRKYGLDRLGIAEAARRALRTSA